MNISSSIIAAEDGLHVFWRIFWQIIVYTCSGLVSDIPLILMNLKLGRSFCFFRFLTISSMVAVFPVPGIPEIYKLEALPPFFKEVVIKSKI
jgi:hypothetical protein